ncbi:hypothetical protein CARUB_v10018650mg [Capsella rubella]|uniref:MATH domain-containing protein n=1 Tax=Capsella rubella TaxID=81985 RepID=R0FRS9_9BRAS|nr:hypothetical protein CARUB_v10018650mg [Capsella rubella]
MGKQVDNTFTWVIKNFSSIQSQKISWSKEFIVGGCKWRVAAYPEVNNVTNYLSLSVYLCVPNFESLPSGWQRHAKYSLAILNQLSGDFYQLEETQQWFDQSIPGWGFPPMLNLNEISGNDGGFLVNDQVIIGVAVDVLEVIGSLDASKTSDDCIDVKGFQVLPSQVKSVNRLFERHPDIASKLSVKNQSLKTAYMNVLLNLTETLHQSPKEISNDDLSDAKTTLTCMKNVGFKLDWLEDKLDEILKREKEAGEIRMEKIEQEYKDLKRKCSSLEALLNKEKADVLAARAPLSLFHNSDDLKWVLRLMACTFIMFMITSI